MMVVGGLLVAVRIYGVQFSVSILFANFILVIIYSKKLMNFIRNYTNIFNNLRYVVDI